MDQVYAAIREGWKTANEIMAETTLERQQVRGVLNAAKSKTRIEKKNVAGTLTYKLKEGASVS